MEPIKKPLELATRILNNDQNDEDDVCCQRCHEELLIQFGSEPTPLCNDCAHETVEQFALVLQKIEGLVRGCETGLIFEGALPKKLWDLLNS